MTKEAVNGSRKDSILSRLPSSRLKSFPILEEPKRHDVIYSLVEGPDGRIYCGLSNEFLPGSHAQIYAFDPANERFEKILDVGELLNISESSPRVPHSKIHLSMAVGRDGRIYAGTYFTAPAPGGRFAPFETYGDEARGYPGGHLISYDPANGRCEDLGLIARYEGPKIMELDRERSIFYFLCYPRVHLYRFDLETRRARDLGRIAQECSYGFLCDSRGYLYFSNDWGRIFRYHPGAGAIEETPLTVPDAPWRVGYGNYVRRMTRGEDDVFWGFGSKSQHLFEIRTNEGEFGKIHDHGILIGKDGSPKDPPPPRMAIALTCCKGDIYAVYMGGESPIAELVKYSPESRDVARLGYLQAKGCYPIPLAMQMITASDGKIYIGSHHAGHAGPVQLLVYDALSESEPAEQEKEDSASAQLLEEYMRPATTSVEVVPNVAHREDSPFITKGRVYLKGLGMELYGQSLPAGESAISSLIRVGKDIYGTTSGSKSHLFKYSPYRRSYYVEQAVSHALPILTIEAGPSIVRALSPGPSEQLLIGTQNLDDEEITGGHLWLYDPRFERKSAISSGHHLPAPPFFRIGPDNVHLDGPILSFEGNGIDALIWDEARNLCYLLLRPENAILAYSLTEKKVTSRAQLPAGPSSRVLALVRSDVLLGSAADGAIFLYDGRTGDLELMQHYLPVEPGRRYLNVIQAMVKHPNGRYYCGTAPDGVLFELNGDDLSMRPVGTVTRVGGITALTVGKDKKLYGFAGDKDGIGRMFSYDPSSHILEVLGIPHVDGEPKYWTGYYFEAMATGADGEIYLGEHDRISHLFTYHPPIQ
jgi:hypothetical protein